MDLNINDTNEISLNKVYYIPKAENTQHTNQVVYYLTNDGQVVTTAPALKIKRIQKVKMKYEFYGDKDYDSLLSKATKALVDSSLERSITIKDLEEVVELLGDYSSIEEKIDENKTELDVVETMVKSLWKKEPKLTNLLRKNSISNMPH